MSLFRCGKGTPGGKLFLSGGALFIIARQGDSPPLAVKRIANPTFLVVFALGPADRMLGDSSFAGEMTLLARLKRDDTAGPAAGHQSLAPWLKRRGQSRCTHIGLMR